MLKICQQCGKEFKVPPYRKNTAKFCSHKCSGEYYSGKNHYLYGKHLSEETKNKMSESRKGENHPFYGKHHSEETKKKMSESQKGKTIGEKHYNWLGGISFKPYCPKFNNKLKEKIREQYGRKCQICGKSEKEIIKDAIKRGKRPHRLSVHHIDMDKEQGCSGKVWNLVPLCVDCHAKLHNKKSRRKDKMVT